METIVEEARKHYRRGLPITEAHAETVEGALLSHLRKELSNTHYTDSEGALSYLETCDSVHTFRTPHATLHVILCGRDHIPRLLIHRVLRRIEAILSIYGCEKHLSFWLLPSPATRMLPDDIFSPIHSKHINGGFTYPAFNEIYIYRREEFPKVMLHETIHHTALDTHKQWALSSGQASLQELYRLFRIDEHGCPNSCATVLNPNEAVVEAWADAYQLAFLSIEQGIPWRRMLDMETAWAWGQAGKILRKQRAIGGTWREGTHAYSYIVLRAILLSKAESMLLLRASKNPAPQLVAILKQSLASGGPVQGLRSAPQDLSRSSSLRMTLFGDM